jgi:hypothetical protein
LANKLPNVFTNPKGVTKSYVPAANTPRKIDVPVGQSKVANESEAKIKRGRPIGYKDINPRKRKGNKKEDGRTEDREIPEEFLDINKNILVSQEIQVPEIVENTEISTNYVTDGIQ